MAIDGQKLRVFVAVAEELHFRRAAERVGLTQPSLSHHVAQLEAELGVKLIDRGPRHVILTDAGQTLLVGARRVLAELDRVIDDVKRVARRRFVLGYVEYMNLPFLASSLRALSEKHEQLEIEHRELYSAQVITELANRTIDVGFAFLPIEHPDLVARPVIEGFWVVVLPESHPLAALEEVPLARLASEPLIIFARRLNPPLHDWLIDRLRESAGNEPRIVYRSAQAQSGPDLVAEGLGLFIVASYVPRALPRGITMRPLAGLPGLRVAAVWRADDPSELVREFREALPRGVTAPLPTRAK